MLVVSNHSPVSDGERIRHVPCCYTPAKRLSCAGSKADYPKTLERYRELYKPFLRGRVDAPDMTKYARRAGWSEKGTSLGVRGAGIDDANLIDSAETTDRTHREGLRFVVRWSEGINIENIIPKTQINVVRFYPINCRQIRCKMLLIVRLNDYKEKYFSTSAGARGLAPPRPPHAWEQSVQCS